CGIDSNSVSMSIDAVLAELRSIYCVDQFQTKKPDPPSVHLTEADIKRWSTLTGRPRDSLYNEIALHLARGFHASELTFEFCDAVVSDVFGIITATRSEWPDLFFEIFCAFDEGEYYHRDKPNEDPI